MWNFEIFGTDVYHIVACFIIYSMLGWLLESIYMSICNRKLTNRGFAVLPFCPIYGFGGVIGYILLKPLAGNIILLYFVGAAAATIFEFIVGKLMLRIFGELWWDYNDKPLNYKGIICLESTVAWGFYAVGIIFFVNHRIVGFIDRYSMNMGIIICRLLLIIFFIDFGYHFLQALDINLREYRQKLYEKYNSFKARWY